MDEPHCNHPSPKPTVSRLDLIDFMYEDQVPPYTLYHPDLKFDKLLLASTVGLIFSSEIMLAFESVRGRDPIAIVKI